MTMAKIPRARAKINRTGSKINKTWAKTPDFFRFFSFRNSGNSVEKGAVGINCWAARGFAVGVPVLYNQ